MVGKLKRKQKKMTKQKKNFLMDVAAIRLSIIFLLVIYHSLCIFTGAWESPYSPPIQILIYDWFGKSIHLFQLETMVFISGLLFGYNAMSKVDSLSFHACVVKKAKRILLPGLFFGVIYYAMFYDLSAPWYTIIYKLLNGCGHLWFLPMIFWCFVFTYIISIPLRKISRKKLYKLILLIALVFNLMKPISMLPFGTGRLGGFFLYFFIGFAMKQEKISFPKSSIKNILMASMLFVLSFLLFMEIQANMQDCDAFAYEKVRNLVRNICHTINALSAIYLIYILANRKELLGYLYNKHILITISGYCYGVYIYHQFILLLLYRHTQLPFAVNAYWLPWIASVITITLSLLLCYFSLKTRLGRFLIG